MSYIPLVISKGTLKQDQLAGFTVLLTGAGGGIGYEAARSLLWLGAKVIIAEVDKEKGKNAERSLVEEFGEGRAFFIHTDIGDEKSVKKLANTIINKFGTPDVIFNNATVAPIGAVHTVGIDKWDMSYAVNLKGPVLLLSHFLPDMLKANKGVIVFVPSSGAAPYMGAYEVFKTAQVELCNTLSGELEGTDVITYSIGPGIVKTETVQKAVPEIAHFLGKSAEEIYDMNKGMLVGVEEAGAGFAASVALAAKYNGLEISSIQALTDAGIAIQEEKEDSMVVLSDELKELLQKLCSKISQTFKEQVEGWYNRSIFQKQWILRDFKKYAGGNPEHFIEELEKLEKEIRNNEMTSIKYEELPLNQLRTYYMHQIDLLKGYERNPDKLKENLSIMNGWIHDIDEFEKNYKGGLDVQP